MLVLLLLMVLLLVLTAAALLPLLVLSYGQVVSWGRALVGQWLAVVVVVVGCYPCVRLLVG